MAKQEKRELNGIGLDAKKSKELSDALNSLLADYSTFYQNTRGFHWHIRGADFFELHGKFEELYNDLFLKIDEVAERILTLGHRPEHRASKYLKGARIPESKKMSKGSDAIRNICAALRSLLHTQRIILDMSDELGDEGTNALMSDYIRQQEKLYWMYSAYLDR